MMKEIKEKEYIKLYNLIEKLQKTNEQIVIAIDGNSTSGKTTFAELLKQKYDANMIHMDDYFRSQAQGPSYKDYANNIDFERFLDQVVKSLENHMDIKYQSFNCKTQKLSDDVTLKKKQMTIIEGAYSMHPDIIHIYNLKIFLKSSLLQQIRRVIKRNGLKELKKFLKIWIPKENKYFKHYKIREKSDFVFKSKH